MTQIIVPRTGATVNGRRPTLEDYVQSMLTTFRANTRKATQFGPAGRAVIEKPGERVLRGPNGEPIRVIENPDGGTQIEHGDHLHAVLRPATVTLRPTTSS